MKKGLDVGGQGLEKAQRSEARDQRRLLRFAAGPWPLTPDPSERERRWAF